LTRGAGSPNEPLKFVGGAVVDPGIYSLRIAVVDSEGRRGSVIRDVSAWKMAGEAFALGDLIVGDMPTAQGQGLTVQVEPYIQSEGVAAYLELYSNTDQTWTGTTVTFELADDADSAPLTSRPASVVPGRQPTWRVASGVIDAKMLPPGRYVARAKIARDGKAVGVLSRPFVFEHVGSAAPAGSVAVAAAAVSFASSLPKFDSAAMLKPEVLGTMLDMVERRSPDLKEAVASARAGRYGPAALEAFSAGDQTAAAFLRGIDFYAKGQVDQAATQLGISAGPRREFFPAAFYLGALFAAAGRDQDAAGVWQLALGTEQRPAAVYMMAADARLRTGQAASAIDILKPAYQREPANEEIARRLAMAYSMTGQHADAIPVLDSYLERRPTDQEMLWAAIVAQYEVARGGQAISSVERAKLRKYSAAYRGPNQPLVDKYLETIGAK
ncbi:MAG TPA: tetratricopeptide repeat protein, partial [Vicinamibacterales bacterium]|nr:tetratricopeptide repeat protein [Vicinamibacterales bacterium]